MRGLLSFEAEVLKKKRTYNVRLVKAKVTYTTREVAELFDIHVRTVQQWYREGLLRIDTRKPSLVLGSDLRHFLTSRRNRRRCKCGPGQLYCLRCGVPRLPTRGEVTWRPINDRAILLTGDCEICGARMNQIGSRTKLEKLASDFTRLERLDENLSVSANSLVNTDKEQVE